MLLNYSLPFLPHRKLERPSSRRVSLENRERNRVATVRMSYDSQVRGSTDISTGSPSI